MKKISNLKNHYIVCGGGRVGLNAARELQKAGKKVVIIEHNLDTIETLENHNFLVLKGNALEESNLTKAGIDRASHLLACLADDSDNLLLTLTAHDINPKIVTGSRAKEEASVSKLHHAGADYVVLPEVIGGVQLAKSIIKGKE